MLCYTDTIRIPVEYCNSELSYCISELMYGVLIVYSLVVYTNIVIADYTIACDVAWDFVKTFG